MDEKELTLEEVLERNTLDLFVLDVADDYGYYCDHCKRGCTWLTPEEFAILKIAINDGKLKCD